MRAQPRTNGTEAEVELVPRRSVQVSLELPYLTKNGGFLTLYGWGSSHAEAEIFLDAELEKLAEAVAAGRQMLDAGEPEAR
jgi:hypothetical protein